MPLQCLLDTTANPPEPDALYLDIEWPEPPEDRPYLYINMAATVDGKIVVGEPNGPAKGVGGPTDQLLFRRLQHNCDAAILGSTTLRASQVIYPPEILRFVVTRKGDVPLTNRFFTDAPQKAYVLVPTALPQEVAAKLKAATNVLQIGQDDVDLAAALKHLRQNLGVRTLLCEGGATLNDQLIRAGLADELFLTLAPKIKGGSHLPTPVSGEGFPPNVALPATLLSLYRDGSELYLRYRLGREPERVGAK
ncbi:MAG: Pyrimidine reductase, riboflavin biosynthesis [Chthonomonadaceae bacterium]|nr:Pyrimidine reductase, riboflavin biosynthesis [Chthonomonadaceae bacterium]